MPRIAHVIFFNEDRRASVKMQLFIRQFFVVTHNIADYASAHGKILRGLASAIVNELLLCGRSNRPHYRPCLSLCSSVAYSSTGTASYLKNKKAHKNKIVVNLYDNFLA